MLLLLLLLCVCVCVCVCVFVFVWSESEIKRYEQKCSKRWINIGGCLQYDQLLKIYAFECKKRWPLKLTKVPWLISHQSYWTFLCWFILWLFMDQIHAEKQNFLLNNILNKSVTRWQMKRTNWPQLFVEKFSFWGFFCLKFWIWLPDWPTYFVVHFLGQIYSKLFNFLGQFPQRAYFLKTVTFHFLGQFCSKLFNFLSQFPQLPKFLKNSLSWFIAGWPLNDPITITSFIYNHKSNNQVSRPVLTAI